MAQKVIIPTDLGSSLEVVANKVEVKVDGTTIVKLGNGSLSAAGAVAPDEVVRAAAALAGVAPADADLGYDTVTGRLYYRDGSSNWQPTAQAIINIDYWETVTAPTATPSTVVTLPVNSPSRRAYGAAWLVDGELWAYGTNANGTAGATNGALDHNRTPTAIPHNAMTFGDVAVGRNPNFVRLWANRQCLLLLDDQGKLWFRGTNTARQSGIVAAAAGEVLELPTIIDFFVTNNLTVVDAWISDGDADDNYTSCYAVTSTGALYVWGRNATGQLGIGSLGDQVVPTLASAPFGGSGVVQIHSSPATSGAVHAAVVLADGRLFVAGTNANGQHGRGNTTQQNTWVQSRTNVAYVHCTTDAMFVIDAVTGGVWGAGWNAIGWFGRNNTTASTSWVQSTSFNEVAKAIRTNGYGRRSIYIVTTTGNLWVGGDNAFCQLGLGAGTATQQNNHVKLSAGQGPFQATVKDVQVAGQSGATAYVITTDGELWSVGYNGYGQRGLGNRLDDAVYRSVWRQVGCKNLVVTARVFATDDSCTIVALDDKGKLRTCGFDTQMINPFGNWSSGLYSVN